MVCQSTITIINNMRRMWEYRKEVFKEILHLLITKEYKPLMVTSLRWVI